jgi:hypothetical protein
VCIYTYIERTYGSHIERKREEIFFYRLRWLFCVIELFVCHALLLFFFPAMLGQISTLSFSLPRSFFRQLLGGINSWKWEKKFLLFFFFLKCLISIRGKPETHIQRVNFISSFSFFPVALMLCRKARWFLKKKTFF